MKKLIFTLAFGLFFVAFANAQESDVSKVAETKTEKVAETKTEKVACKLDCTKPCCADKKSKAECKKKKAKCKKKKAECKKKKAECKKKKAEYKEKKEGGSKSEGGS